MHLLVLAPLNEVDNFSFEIDYKTTAYANEYNTFWQINIKEDGRANIYKIFKNNLTNIVYDYSEQAGADNMAKNVKNIGIDLGNSTICVAGMEADGNIKNAYTYSVYSTDTALMSGDIIECRGTKIALRVGQSTLTNVDKTNREYIEHQILWAVNAVYDSGTHYINLGTGLPISIYKAKKEEFA